MRLQNRTSRYLKCKSAALLEWGNEKIEMVLELFTMIDLLPHLSPLGHTEICLVLQK